MKMHPWFAHFDWAGFSKRQLKAPYVPQVCKSLVLQDRMCPACEVPRFRPADSTRRCNLEAHAACIHAYLCRAQPCEEARWLGSLLLQVSHPEDRRNFSGGAEDSHPAGKSNKRYVSTGLFKDF